jgi:NTP pyrophosphatase (non-canonical NTP hydrolase)
MSIYEKAVKRWGWESQLGMLQEECAELIAAVSKVTRRKPGAVELLAEEMADVEIMLEQVKTFAGKERVEKYRKMKLHRLKELIERPKP